MGALITTFYIDNVYNKAAYCGIRRWCQSAQWLAKHAVPGLEVLVLHNHESVVRTRKGSQRQDLSDAVRKECPHARVVEFDPELVAVAKRWQNRSRDLLSEHLGACPAYGVQKTLLKWAALDPRIYTSRLGRPPIALFLDSDVDATWHSSVVAQIMSGRLNVSQKLDAFVNDPSCQVASCYMRL